MLLLLEKVGKLSAERGLTRTLQTAHQDDGRTACEVQIGSFATHQLGQLVVYDLDHQLAWLYSCEHVHAKGFLLHRVGEVLGHLIVDVGVEQCTAHILQCLGYVNLGDFSLTFQYLETALQSVA